MLVRWLFSLAASCYIVAALALPGLWLRSELRLPLAAWWPSYAALELLVVGLPVSYAVWRLLWQPASVLEAARPTHFTRLAAGTIAVVYGFLVIPAGCFIALPYRANVYAGFLTFAAAALVAIVYLQFARRAG